MNALTRAIMNAAMAPEGPVGPTLPLNWSTDLDFTRASAATHWDGTTVTRYAIDAPRVLVGGALYVEGSRTNKIHDSSTYSAPALSGATAVVDAAASPAGDPTSADEFTITAAAGRTGANTSTNMLAGRIAASVFVQYAAGADTLSLSQASTAGSGSTAVLLDALAAWRRFQNINPASPGGALQMRLQENDVANNNVFRAWGWQAEDGGFASQMIETAGAAGTRLPDDAVIPSADVPAAMRSGSWRTTIAPARASTQVSDTTTETLYSFGSGLDNCIVINASNQIVVRASGVDVVTTGALTWSADQAITLTLNAAAGTVLVSGATTGNGTTTGTPWTMPTGDVQVGNDAALTTAFFGAVSPPEAP
jgi:hypothetical protein